MVGCLFLFVVVEATGTPATVKVAAPPHEETVKIRIIEKKRNRGRPLV
jgi:hypothetical protein